MRLEGIMEDKWNTLWRAEGFVGPYASDVQYGLTQSEWRASMNMLLNAQTDSGVSMNTASTACMIR